MEDKPNPIAMSQCHTNHNTEPSACSNHKMFGSSFSILDSSRKLSELAQGQHTPAPELTFERAAYVWLKSAVSTSSTPLHASYSLLCPINPDQDVAMAVYASLHSASPWKIHIRNMARTVELTPHALTLTVASSVPRNNDPIAIAFNKSWAEQSRYTNVG